MAAIEPLFDPSLISPDVVTSLPDNYAIRPLDRSDYVRGFLDCLRVLSHVGDLTEAQFHERFDWLRTQGKGVQYHIVIEHEGLVVGTGALIVERKFIHDLGIVGHVEEIAVRGDYQGQGIGIRILAGLTSIAEGVGCYKSTLQCSEKNEPFYLKCGYEKREGKVMSQYYEEIKESYMRG